MSEMPTPADDLVVIGKIVSVYGIRGEVKVYSFTDPLDNLLDYRRWTLRRDGEIRQAELVRGACMARSWPPSSRGSTIAKRPAPSPVTRSASRVASCPLEEGEYYWHQLEGLKVIDQGGRLLGVIDHLLETGANDVMVVKPCAGSLDDRERLLPYTGQCVLSIDLAAGEMRVDWDADF